MEMVRLVLAEFKHMMARTLYGISSIWDTAVLKEEHSVTSSTHQDPRQ